MNTLHLRYDVEDDRLTLRPFIDGQDLLAAYENGMGLDPDRLLPPVASVLLPTAAGHAATIGSCWCGETGCGSVSVRIARIGGEVAWEPDPNARHETLDRSYRFELRQYLDAVDGAAGDPPPDEGRGRRVARAVRVELADFARAYEETTAFEDGVVDWIAAWPWTSDTVQVSITRSGKQRITEFPAGPAETDAAFARRVAGAVRDAQR